MIDGEKKIAIFGLGYVGMSLAVLFGTRHKVKVFDVDKSKLEKVRNNISTIDDLDIQNYLDKGISKLDVCENVDDLLKGVDYVILCTPTNFDVEKSFFDTSSVDWCVKTTFEKNPDCLMIIKSTIPIGYVEAKRKQFATNNIIFCPEFLQEGTALRDNLRPERIVIGSKCERSFEIKSLFLGVCTNKQVPTIFVAPTEAESVKLFANNFLAMRVAFFNELDSFAMRRGLNSQDIITAVSGDRRIGNFYNNPSFGYGGYCLPKDVQQLYSEIVKDDDYDSPLISSIQKSNVCRKKYIVRHIVQSKANTIGIYGLAMKMGSKNFRESSIIDIMMLLSSSGKTILIFEPLISEKLFKGFEIINDFENFEARCDVIIANRSDLKIENSSKLFTRDLFHEN